MFSFELEIGYLNFEVFNLNFNYLLENWNFNSRLLFWILKINISIQKIIN